MDKYQKIYFEKLFGNEIGLLYSTDLTKAYYKEIRIEDNCIKLLQDEDITIQNYSLLFNNLENVDNVRIYYTYDDVKWQEVIADKIINPNLNINANEFMAKILLIDFNKPIKSIKICAKNDIIEPIIFTVEYVEADKEKYYTKIEKARKDDLLTNAQVKHSTGNGLVNIYFQPCCNEYAHTTIIIYTKEQQLMAKYKVDTEVYFKSISGLAYGTYYYELIQYNANGKELLHTEKIKFVISGPVFPHRPVNVIS